MDATSGTHEQYLHTMSKLMIGDFGIKLSVVIHPSRQNKRPNDLCLSNSVSCIENQGKHASAIGTLCQELVVYEPQSKSDCA
jgi:hypothetical protein